MDGTGTDLENMARAGACRRASRPVGVSEVRRARLVDPHPLGARES